MILTYVTKMKNKEMSGLSTNTKNQKSHFQGQQLKERIQM